MGEISTEWQFIPFDERVHNLEGEVGRANDVNQLGK